jgi:hypothetical protein
MRSCAGDGYRRCSIDGRVVGRCNVPRSLAAALTPLAASWLLTRTAFGWPLVFGGLTNALYDQLLLWQFRAVTPPEEQPTSRG